MFVSALEGKGRIEVMQQVIETYKKWCLRLSTARLNRWLRKVNISLTIYMCVCGFNFPCSFSCLSLIIIMDLDI